MMGFGMIGMFLFWIILIFLAVFLVRGLFQTNHPSGNTQLLSARQILEQRYARGEINHEQYLLMMKDIQ
ncbi:MAG: electron transporter RnfE [Anaerolinea sp.]|nr:electron transporter RnfE [Anaerolinea sp.]